MKFTIIHVSHDTSNCFGFYSNIPFATLWGVETTLPLLIPHVLVEVFTPDQDFFLKTYNGCKQKNKQVTKVKVLVNCQGYVCEGSCYV